MKTNPGKNKPHSSGKDEDAFKKNTAKEGEDNSLPGYPVYPPKEDIYNIDEEVDVDPEDPSRVIRVGEKSGIPNENEFGEPILLNDLDVPGSELDDEQEDIGNEDEENNYYSLDDEDSDDVDLDDLDIETEDYQDDDEG